MYIYIHHVRSNQTNGTVHAHKHHDIGEKMFFAESNGNMQSAYSKQTQIHHNITSMMLYVDELSSKCFIVYYFFPRKPNQLIFQNHTTKSKSFCPSNLNGFFPHCTLHKKKQTSQRELPMKQPDYLILNIAIAGWYCML